MSLTGHLVWWPDEELSSEALVDALAIFITAKPKIGQCLKSAKKSLFL